MMNIFDTADKYGTTPRTLRFWESKGLISPSRQNGKRVYDEADMSDIEGVFSLKALGLELDQIWDVLNGKATVESMLQGLKDKAGADLVEVHARLAAIAEWEGQ